ncbi:hypothetical protein Y032_0097g3000 [Ancylostoma ceylanicum]|uniref:7TM GPCR serpentine receptor class x (Srx) domain-containing protein n=1 Tax=Ancylostoma ceylanicum TaxID=53326 RepID=A0A016TJX3_9BILA|nr:hypothetical protein Y032_0097g3000 [Ancylostoma ceylanicum]
MKLKVGGWRCRLIPPSIPEISLSGSIGNSFAAISTQRFPSFRNSFGLLLTSQSIAEAVLCLLFAFFYSPMVFL